MRVLDTAFVVRRFNPFQSEMNYVSHVTATGSVVWTRDETRATRYARPEMAETVGALSGAELYDVVAVDVVRDVSHVPGGPIREPAI